MTLFFDNCGPLLRYAKNTLEIRDLNPEASINWRMQRSELLMLGLRCILAAIKGR